MTSLLLKYNSPKENIDILGRKPIYFAIKNKDYITLELLLRNKCSPWSYLSDSNFFKLCNNDDSIISYLIIMRKIFIIRKFVPINIRKHVDLKFKKIVNSLTGFNKYIKLKKIVEYFKSLIN